MTYKLTAGNVVLGDNGKSIPADTSNKDYREYLAWVAQGNVPLSADPAPTIQTQIAFDVPIKAPDFIVATPPIKSDPVEALNEAISEMEKGSGNPKSVVLIALSITKYLKFAKDKIK